MGDIQALGARLEQRYMWVAEQLTAKPESRCATLVHGDYKAMNILLAENEGYSNVLIDFAQTGPGFGMSDVAFLLCHSVAPEVLEDGGEERLIAGYLEALRQAQKPDASEYMKETAIWHYRLGIVDYGRFILSRFWHDASPETFEEKAPNMNITLPNRNLKAALYFVKRIDECLRCLEQSSS